MGIKQLRLSDRQIIQKRIGEFVGQPINIVLKNSLVMMGTLVGSDNQSIVLENMRLKKVRYTLDTIDEIYFDTKA
jgi:hypothetical protein